MIRNIYFCIKETNYAGQHYWPGQAWDEDVPEPPPIGDCWVLRPFHEPDAPVNAQLRDSIVTSSSRGSARWVPQPGRPRATPPTPEELEQERDDPYGLKAREARRRSEQDQEEDPGNAKFNEAGRLRMEEIYRLAAEDDARIAAERGKEFVESAASNADPPCADEPSSEETSFLTG